MESKEDQLEKIIKLHPLGFKGLIKIYETYKILRNRSFLFSFFIAFLCFILISYLEINSIKLTTILKNIIEIGLALNGGLMGLSLTGLTLIVTFGSEKLLKTGVKINFEKNFPKNEKRVELEFSSYQKSVAKFTFAIFIQILALFVFIAYSINGSFEWYICFNSNFFMTIFSCIGIFFIFYPLALVLQMTLNIYSLSQLNHIVYFHEEFEKVSAKEDIE